MKVSETITQCTLPLLYSENALLDFLSDFLFLSYFFFFLKTEVTTNEGESFSFSQKELFVELRKKSLKYICALSEMEEHCQPGV